MRTREETLEELVSSFVLILDAYNIPSKATREAIGDALALPKVPCCIPKLQKLRTQMAKAAGEQAELAGVTGFEVDEIVDALENFPLPKDAS